jgi:hypothetical protein
MPANFYQAALIKTYEDATKWFATARNPIIGKPLKKWARVYKVGDTFEFRFGNTTFAQLTPDNILTFPLTVMEMKVMSITFSQASHRALPILFQRIATGRYAIEHTLASDERFNGGSVWLNLKREAPEYFQGIKFDMNTGKCLNQRPRITDAVNDAARKEWLSKLRKFKRGMKLRAKIGAIQTICQQVAIERDATGNTWSQPDWSNEVWLNMLYTSIRDEQYTTDLIRGFVMSSRVSYWRRENPTPVSTLEAVDSVCNLLSVELRRKFGVFEQGENDGTQ